MDNFLFNKIVVIIDKLIATEQKLTTDNVITASLFIGGGTLVGFEEEINQVIKMYKQGINEFTYTYAHNGNKERFTLHINQHGVMCLGFKDSTGKKYYQCAMDRHIEKQMQLILILSKTSKDTIMQTVYIPNNISYLNNAQSKIKV